MIIIIHTHHSFSDDDDYNDNQDDDKDCDAADDELKKMVKTFFCIKSYQVIKSLVWFSDL